MKKYSLLFLIIAMTSSCAMQELYLNVTQPAPVTIAPEIKTVGIIDRSTPTDETEIVDLLEKVLTLEGEDLDIIGSGEAIKGMTEELTANDRFNEVKPVTGTKFKTTYTGGLPAPLMWEQIDLICRESGTDALFAMEMYDTDTRINYSTENVRVPTPMGDIPMLEHIVSMETLVKGASERDESLEDAANRELKEEIGMGARTIRFVKRINIAPGHMGFTINVMLATDLYPERLPADEPEPPEVVPWPVERLDDLLHGPEFREARAIAALYLARPLIDTASADASQPSATA